MFEKIKPDLNKELKDCFSRDYSKAEDAILKRLQQKAYERLSDNPNDIYLGKLELATFEIKPTHTLSNIVARNKNITIYINNKVDIDYDIVVQTITDYFGGSFDSNGYLAENITVSRNGNIVTLTANDVTFDNEGSTKDEFSQCEEIRRALDVYYRKYFSERLNVFDEVIFENYKHQILRAKEDGTLDTLLGSKQLRFGNTWMNINQIPLVQFKTEGTRPFDNGQDLRCYILGKGTVDGRSDYNSWAVGNLNYLRDKLSYLAENYNKELEARANELARLANGRVDKNTSELRYTIIGEE